ncbi:hypothetical protein GDO81_027589 [Engystomops pustulosus]|uniref:Uncharacterized protein n=1 Tax=Engystomops pustulosus TaxID=76066 RepID=A0AAV6ZK72_ENGPU|nr:hypothetical protein GDO81_027589 [Engystomops pustulosus]
MIHHCPRSMTIEDSAGGFMPLRYIDCEYLGWDHRCRDQRMGWIGCLTIDGTLRVYIPPSLMMHLTRGSREVPGLKGASHPRHPPNHWLSNVFIAHECNSADLASFMFYIVE